MAEREDLITRTHYQPTPMSCRLLDELRAIVTTGQELPAQKNIKGFAYGLTQFGDGRLNPNNPDDYKQMIEHIRNGRR